MLNAAEEKRNRVGRRLDERSLPHTAGVTLVETVAALLILFAAALMLFPVVSGLRTVALEKTCRKNRARVEAVYADYMSTAAGSGDLPFREYASIRIGDLDGLCPAGGAYTLIELDRGTSAASVRVHCSAHSEAFVRVRVPAIASREDALAFAQDMYELGLLFLDRLLSENERVEPQGYLPFDRVGIGETGETAGEYRAFVLTNGGKSERYAASDEFRKLLVYDGRALPLGRIYFTPDAAGRPTTEIDYVVVRQGGFWAKYAENAMESGAGGVDPSTGPGRG